MNLIEKAKTFVSNHPQMVSTAKEIAQIVAISIVAVALKAAVETAYVALTQEHSEEAPEVVEQI